MTVESPRFLLVEDLLKDGYTVYVQEIDDVIDQHEDELIDLYGDNIIFVKNPAEIHEPVWRIDF